MKITRELIIIIALLLISVWDVNPRQDQYAELKDQLGVLKKQLSREDLLAHQQADITGHLDSELTTHQQNLKALFPASIPPSTAMSQLQETVQKEAQQQGLQIQNIRWGEPFKPEGATYYKLPISFSFHTYPPELVGFLSSVVRIDKFLTCPLLTINRQGKDKLSVEIMLTGYQLASDGVR